MKLVQIVTNGNTKRVGTIIGEKVYDISDLFRAEDNYIQVLIEKTKELNKTISEIVNDYCSEVGLESLNVYQYVDLNIEPNDKKPYLTIPVDPPEVWCAGVTYMRSKEAREFETETKSIYDKVYDAARPEIFLKATSQRIVGPNVWVGLRNDSNWMVPEPELGVVIDGEGNIIGFLIGNDMSSRDIEGENPLYLPQAKVFKHACSIGPIFAPSETVTDPLNLEIVCRIIRENKTVFEDSANTSQLKRSLEELVACLIKDNDHYFGTVLMTGTCIVPPNNFTLLDNDIIEIEIEELGLLRNKAKKIV